MNDAEEAMGILKAMWEGAGGNFSFYDDDDWAYCMFCDASTFWSIPHYPRCPQVRLDEFAKRMGWK